MVSQCANPECQAPFIYLRSGRLLSKERQVQAAKRTVEWFWFCGRCSALLDLEHNSKGEIEVVPRVVK